MDLNYLVNSLYLEEEPRSEPASKILRMLVRMFLYQEFPIKSTAANEHHLL